MSFRSRSRGVWARRKLPLICLCVALAVLSCTAALTWASHLGSDVEGHTTVDLTICGNDPSSPNCLPTSARSNTAYYPLQTAPGEPYVTRELGSPVAQPGRAQRRTSLTYFAQLSDFQLADEESPARVEFLDRGANDVASAWRPQEALQPFVIEYSLRQVNRFAAQSPVAQAGGARAAMDFALMTGDQADSQQRKEVVWRRGLLEG